MKFKELFKLYYDEKESDNLNFRMKKLFYKRTLFHIYLVRKYLQKIINLKDERIDDNILKDEMVTHDESKFHEPEFKYYIHINWKYHLKSKGIEYEPGYEIEKGMKDASFFHVRNNPHHSEFWDDNYKIDGLSGKLQTGFINAATMPFSYIACMLADWFAMDEELNGNLKEWINNFFNKCKFTEEQKEFIWYIVNKVYYGKI